MDLGIVGLPNVGKSTLFNAITAAGAAAENYPFCTIEPSTGVVSIPDERLRILKTHIATGEVIPAALRIVDIAGLVEGASRGEGLGNQFLAHIRQINAVIHVLRAFKDPNVVHVAGEADPLRDIDIVETELMVADLAMAESALEKARTRSRRNDKEAAVRARVLERCIEALSNDIPLRNISFGDPEEQKSVRGIGFLTAKPVLYLLNVDESDLKGESHSAQAVQRYAQERGGRCLCVCAQLEAELTDLDPDEREELAGAEGIYEPALHAVARSAFELLDLRTFFTTGDKEIHAWPVKAGTTAPEAAGKVHTDFQQGFIKAEVYHADELQTYKSEAAIRQAGRMRTEGKEYVIQDGDVCRFFFNV